MAMKPSPAAIVVILFFAALASAQKRMSDREADGLKGKVQKVVTEEAKLTNESDNWVEGKRQIDSVITYDADGNRLKYEIYDSRGNLSTIDYYSVLDRDRVIKEETVSSNALGRGSSVSPGTDNARPTDSRYTYKLKYKYDDKGNRTEEMLYRNGDSSPSRYVSVYDERGDKVRYERYASNGKLVTRGVLSYDNKGNVIEETVTMPSSPWLPDEKLSYSYEFDAQGNWVKQKRMRWVTKNGKSYFEPFGAIYREIAYF